MRFWLAAVMISLVGCREHVEPRSIRPVHPGTYPWGPFPIDVEASRMVVTVRPGAGSPCAGYSYPLDLATHFDYVTRRIIATSAARAVRRATLVARRFTIRVDAEQLLNGAVSVVSVAMIAARIRLDTAGEGPETPLQATGTSRPRSMAIAGQCDSMREALSEAYEDAMTKLASQIVEHMRAVR